jgi:ABC-type glycerol-3-phosphate transport system substrate-binding protein
MEDQKAFLNNSNRKRLQYPRGVGSSINKEEKMRKPIMLLVMSIALAIGLVGCKPSVQEPQKVTLKVFMTFPRFQTQFEAYFEQFRVKYLEEKNIDVTIELEMPNSDQAAQILKARLSSNDAPDLFTLHAIADIPSFYEAGYLSDLSDQPFADDLLENVKDIVTYDGKVVALPLESLAWGYLYNKDIFADLGLTPPDTIAEMQNVVDVLKANDKTPFLLAFQESWIPQLMTALAIGGVVTNENPTFVDDMNAKTANYGTSPRSSTSSTSSCRTAPKNRLKWAMPWLPPTSQPVKPPCGSKGPGKLKPFSTSTPTSTSAVRPYPPAIPKTEP